MRHQALIIQWSIVAVPWYLDPPPFLLPKSHGRAKVPYQIGGGGGGGGGAGAQMAQGGVNFLKGVLKCKRQLHFNDYGF